MGTIEPAPRPRSRDGIGLLWPLALVLVGAGLWLWQARSERGTLPTARPVEHEVTPERVRSDDGAQSQAPARQLAELESEIEMLRAESRVTSQEILRLRRELEEAKASEQRYRDGLDEAVVELNRLESELGRIESKSLRPAQPTGSLLPVDKTRPLGPPRVLISQMGFVTVSGLVRNPTRYVSRGRLEVSLVGSGGVIETRGFSMRVGPESTERYDITFPGIFPTERIAAKADWVD